MEDLKATFLQNGFIVTKEVKKAIEFTNEKIGQVIYLLPNSEITIVLDPKVVESSSDLLEKTYKKNHNTSFKKFPKRQHTGKSLITYGYSFKFQSADELSRFLERLDINKFTNI